MTYATASINSATPATELMTAIEAALTTAGFTLEDTVVSSGRTHRIWKSAAAGNSRNLDWFLHLSYLTVGTGTVQMAAFEYFDPATHLAYRGTFSGAQNESTLPETTYYSRFGDTGYALDNTNWNGHTFTPFAIATSTSVAFTHWISITTDRVLVMTSAAATKVNWAGLYEVTADYEEFLDGTGLLFPLGAGHVNSAAFTTDMGGFTRWPKKTTTATWYRANYMAVMGAGGAALDFGIFGISGRIGTTPGEVANGPKGSKVPIAHPLASTSSSYAPSTRMGYAPDILMFLADSSVARGDTLEVGGDDYILTSYGNTTYQFAFAMKAV